MLPSNVMSFVKKMVTTQSEANSSTTTTEDSSKTFSKLRQIGTDFMIATGNVTKLPPPKVTPVDNNESKKNQPIIELNKVKTDQEKTVNRAATCRVCIKSIKPEDFSRTCYECQRKVCEDCASYSMNDESNDARTWCCSVCRRKLIPRDHVTLRNESTESSLEVPVHESLQRRHSDARLLSQSTEPTAILNTSLVLPRNTDVRRHSDVSSASMKDLEKFRKVASQYRNEDRVWYNKSRSSSPDHYQDSSRDRKNDQSKIEEKQYVNNSRRISKPFEKSDPNNDEDTGKEEEHQPRSFQSGTMCHKSRLPRQHSYDDEIKNTDKSSSSPLAYSNNSDTGLRCSVVLARRASAYDVYSTVGNSEITGTIMSQHRGSTSTYGNRESESERKVNPSSRRSSFRNNKPLMSYEFPASTDYDKLVNYDGPQITEMDQNILMPDEELRTRRRGSQLPNIQSIRAQANTTQTPLRSSIPTTLSRVNVDERELTRQGSLVDGEGIKIVIHDVDCNTLTRQNTKRKLLLQKDFVVEKGHRTRNFGMRVVGGKISDDNHLYAIVVWIIVGGPADKAGLQQGDKILEWNGVSLIDLTFEEVAHIITHTGDIVEVTIEHTTETSGDFLDESAVVSVPEKTLNNLGTGIESEMNKTPSSPTRRKLPKTPDQIAKNRQITGRVQIQVWYESDRKELVVSVLAADDLTAREENGYGTAPEAFAKLDLISPNGDSTSLKTDVAEATHNPIWNATLNFIGVDEEQLIEKIIDITLWDYYPDRESIFLGGCSIDLTSAFEVDRAVWYRLEDPRSLRSNKSPHCSPRGSISTDLTQRLLRRIDLRECSDDAQSDSGSPEPYFLHPDHAWLSNSRRGSSQSEQLEVEPYELNKDYSHSLPGSRRSSFQSQNGSTDTKRSSTGETDVTLINYNRERRRSSFTRPMRDHEEILETLRNLKAESVKGEFSQATNFSVDKNLQLNRKNEHKEYNVLERHNCDKNSESNEDETWSESIKGEVDETLILGPGQITPKGYKITKAQKNGKLQLAIFLNKGNLEVEVISAKDIVLADAEEPDTYVKMYLRAEERWLHKRKTRVVRHSRNPQYRQTLKYPSCDALGRNLLVMLWKKKQGFESNHGLGGAEIELDALTLTRQTIGWYYLFPIHTLGAHNVDSP